MKKKIIAIALALCMVTSLLPATVLAASEGEPQCTVTEGCTLSNGHEGECVLPEEGGEPDAPAACTKTEGCTLAEGHEGVCVLPEEGGEPDAPAACTKTEGCTLAEGHEGACVLPEEGGEPDAPAACTKTEGCTLAEGHEGECVLPKENGEPVVTMLDGVNTLAAPRVGAVCTVGGTDYVTLQDAFADAPSGSTIEMTADIAGMTTDMIATVPVGKTFTLNMAGHSITVDQAFTGRPIVNEGVLTITGNGTIDSSDSEAGGFGAVNNKGTLIVENGTYRGAKYASGSSLRNTGAGAVLTVKDGLFEEATCAIFNEGTVTINGGTFTGTTCSQCNSDIWSYTIRNYSEYSKMTINGGTFTGVQGAVSASIGYLEVNGGTFKTVACEHHGTAATFYALYAAGEAGKVLCVINDGYFETEGRQTAVLIGNDNTSGDGGINAPATGIVRGGTFVAPVGVPALKGAERTGDPQITGGTFTSDVSQYVPGHHMAVEEDGTFVVEPVTQAVGVAAVGQTYYRSLESALEDAENGETVRVLKNAESAGAALAGKEVTLDLAGCEVALRGPLVAGEGAHLIIEDSADATEGKPTVSKDNKVTYDAGRLYAAADAGMSYVAASAFGGSITLKSGIVDGLNADSFALYAQGDVTGAADVASTVTVDGGYVLAQEFALSAQGCGAAIRFNGGAAEARDNAVIGGNGSNAEGNRRGGTDIRITGGTLIAHIETSGYASCGVYHPQEGTLTITGGTIYSENGCGVLMRGGEMAMTGGTIVAGGDPVFVGKVGDSKVVVTPSGVVFDRDAGYYDAPNAKVDIGGTAEVSGTLKAIDVLDTKAQNASEQVDVTGGKFSSDVKEFVPEGNTTDTDSEGNFIVVVDKAKAVAEANGVGYTTVQAAIDAVANSDAAGTVKLLQSKAESVAVPAGANVTLDIPAGVTLTNTNGAHTITNSGTLAITGEGTVDNVTHAKGALVNLSGAQAVIRGGMLTRSSEASTSASQSGGNSWYVIDNHGTLEIAGGKVVNEGHFSSLIRNVGDSAAAKAVLTISGGEVEQMGFIAVKNDDNSILNVTGGVIRSNEQAVQNWTQANISGGRLEGNVITWAYGDQPSETNIAGSAVVDGDVAAVNYMDAAAQPVVNITGGTVTGSIYKGEHKGSGGIIHTAADSTGADINVSGGTFKKPVDPAFCAEGFAPNKDPITGDYTVHTHAFVKTEAVAASCAAPGTEAYWTCSVCGKLFSDEAGANEIAAPVIVPKTAHTLVKTEAVAPTCTKEGSEAYWTCSGCGKLFSDGNGVNEIAAPVAMSKTAHTPVAAWSSDGSNHWHVCSVCGEKLSQGTHTFGEWHTTLAPTATKTGVQEKNCTVCGYGVCATVPATGTSTPQTGDPFNVWLFVGLLCIGTTGLVVLTGVQLKKHRAGK
ncbi:hypothetical protein [Ruthenibacterium lactatiformans]|uniref:hypothetical protein n=2 Tax=Clostridia TaxID=186801 RepID=UPI00267222DE|nr:hypothetical protein [Ruthenibacterium lactatiformans]